MNSYVFTGAITAEESLFTYKRGKNHSSYANPGYTPEFLDSNHVVFTNRSFELQARRVCGNDKRCLFDIKTTGNIDVGKSSLIASQDFEIAVNDTETKGKWKRVIRQLCINSFLAIVSPAVSKQCKPNIEEKCRN